MQERTTFSPMKATRTWFCIAWDLPWLWRTPQKQERTNTCWPDFRQAYQGPGSRSARATSSAVRGLAPSGCIFLGGGDSCKKDLVVREHDPLGLLEPPRKCPEVGYSRKTCDNNSCSLLPQQWRLLHMKPASFLPRTGKEPRSFQFGRNCHQKPNIRGGSNSCGQMSMGFRQSCVFCYVSFLICYVVM